MGRLYTAAFKSIAVTAVQDLFEITSPTDGVTVVHEWGLFQTTELGDLAEEQLLITTNRGTNLTTSGSGGATVTPPPISVGDPAYGGSVERNNTTIMAVGTGALTELEVFAWNIRVPFQKIYTPETRPIISPGFRWTLELESVPADSITMHGYVTFEEIGG